MTEMLKNRLGGAQGLEVYLNRRVMAVLLLGFSSGLPFLLIGGTLSARLAEAEVDISTIGLFGFVLAPYTLKFLWAPLMDKAPLPPLTTLLGRRRGWLIAAQLGLMAAIFGLGQADPLGDLRLTALAAFAVAFFSASQDIVIDAYRIEILAEDQQGAGAATVVTGYRFGMWVAGAGALFLAHLAGWPAAYAAMALLVLVGLATTLLSPEPDDDGAADAPPAPESTRTGHAGTLRILGVAAGLGLLAGLLLGRSQGMETGLLVGGGVFAAAGALLLAFSRTRAIREGAIEPFQDFFARNGVTAALVILVFISLFKASDVLISLIANPFYIGLGFTKQDIAWVSGTFGFAVVFLGSYLAGALIYRIGLLASLWISGVLMMGSNLMFALQAMAGDDYALFHLTIFVENLSGGMGTTAFVAYLASLCNRRYTAVQYALLTSFMQILGKFVIVPSSGFLVEALGWVPFFFLSAAAGAPALLLLWWLSRNIAVEAAADDDKGALSAS